METFKTISGREIKVSANKSKRTFTIKTDSGKYKTSQFNKDEFNNMEYYNGNDWQDFLNSSSDYYLVK